MVTTATKVKVAVAAEMEWWQPETHDNSLSAFIPQHHDLHSVCPLTYEQW